MLFMSWASPEISIRILHEQPELSSSFGILSNNKANIDFRVAWLLLYSQWSKRFFHIF